MNPGPPDGARTSPSAPRSVATPIVGREARAPCPAGFTLIEVIVVLVILGLLAGLVLPNMPGLFESATRATERDRILDQFAALGAEALRQGRDFAVLGTGPDFDPDTYTDFEPYPFVVPEGWEVLVEKPILVRSNGVCLGGRVTLRHAEAPPTELALVPPLCQVAADT